MDDQPHNIAEIPASPYFFCELPFRTALDWSLVLNALSIEHTLFKTDISWTLLIPPDLLERGELEIILYENEKNTIPAAAPAVDYFPVNRLLIFAFFLALLLFHIFINYTDSDYYYGLGELSTQKVLDGEWWRSVTALTLHSDFQHLAMNTFFGVTFLVVLSYLTGTELAISLTLISGVYGNLINAFLHKFDYRSIGFSTAVFGTLGIIVGMQLFGKYGLKSSAHKIIFSAALLFFTLFGIGGERVDAGAHLLGLFCGLIIGGVTSFWDVVRHPGFKTFKHLLFIATLLTVVFCWML